MIFCFGNKMNKFEPISEILDKHKNLSFIEEMFLFVFRNTEINKKELSWITQGIIEKINLILCYKRRFNFSSVKFPINIIPQIRLDLVGSIYTKFQIAINFFNFFSTYLFNLEAHSFVKVFRQKKTFSFIKLYLIYSEIYKAKKIYENQKSVISDLKISDSMNFSLENRIKLTNNISSNPLEVSVHGGGYFLYKNLSDKFYFDYARNSYLRETLFFGLHNQMQYVSEKKSKKKKEFIVSFAPYFYDVTSVEVTGQVVPGISENLNFMTKLHKQYYSSVEKIIIRDPSGASYKILRKKNADYLTNLEFDLGQKNQRDIDKGADWSKNFIKSDITYVGSFFTLSLQLLFANKPFVSLINTNNLYSIFNEEAKELTEYKVFSTSLNDMIFFRSKEDIYNWWQQSKEARFRFLEKYLMILNSIGNGLDNFSSVSDKTRSIYDI